MGGGGGGGGERESVCVCVCEGERETIIADLCYWSCGIITKAKYLLLFSFLSAPFYSMSDGIYLSVCLSCDLCAIKFRNGYVC